MKALELKIPPLFLMLAFILAMVELDGIFPVKHASFHYQMDHGIIIGLIGAVICGLGVHAFKKAKTTMNPTNPDEASSLVITSAYKYTRNPMYLGFLLIIIATALILSNPYMWAGPVLFILYMNNFQIIPEERVMQRLFTDEYLNYCQKVRRWI